MMANPIENVAKLDKAPSAHAEAAASAKNTLQEAATTYRVCKGGTVVFPPAKCPEQEQKYIQF